MAAGWFSGIWTPTGLGSIPRPPRGRGMRNEELPSSGMMGTYSEMCSAMPKNPSAGSMSGQIVLLWFQERQYRTQMQTGKGRAGANQKVI